MKLIKNFFAVFTFLLIFVFASVGTAFAGVVYYKGVAISWDYGVKYGVVSYSDVQSGVFEHSATANTTFSGWKAPGVRAHAEQFVGLSRATAFWNARDNAPAPTPAPMCIWRSITC